MFYQATVHILLCGVETQDQACDGMSELLSYALPDFVVDWAYTRDRSGTALLPTPRPDLKDLGYEEGEFLNTQEPQHPCPYCAEPMQVIEPRYHYDQDGYSELVLWCPNCGAQQVIKNIPPEEDPNGA